jgi:hypothetical protein
MRAGPFALAILISASAAFAAQPMGPSDIQTTFFNGQPFTASTQSGTKFKMIFMPDGSMTREPLGRLELKVPELGNSILPAFARLGSSAKPTVTPSSQVARTSGRLKIVRP